MISRNTGTWKINLHGYSKLGALGRALRNLRDGGAETVYMLPSLSSRDALADMTRAGASVLSDPFDVRPEVWSWSEMYSKLTPPGELRRQIDPPDHRLILRFILDKNIEELDRLGEALPSGVRRRGFIDILSASLRELLLEGIDPDALLRSGGDGGGRSGRGKRDLLYRLYSDYLFYLEENGLADNSQIPSLLASSLENSAPERLKGKVLTWVGFLSLTGAQLRLVRTLRGLGVKMEFFVPETGLENFRDLSAQLDAPKSPLDGPGGAVAFLTARDAFDQYEAIARELALAASGEGSLYRILREPGAIFDAGILTPRGRLPFMISALDSHGVPRQSRAETRVYETAVMELVRKSWEAYSLDWPYRKTLHIVKRDAEGPLDLNDLPEGRNAWRNALTPYPALLSLFERLNSFCEFLDSPGGHDARELLGALLALFDEEREALTALEAGDDPNMDFAVRETVSSRLEIEQKLRALSEQSSPLGPAGAVRFEGAEAMGFLSDWAKEAVTALPQPLRGAVSVYDSPPPVLASHRLWIITDADPTRFPGALSEHPLLDGPLREDINSAGESFHLPTLHEKREQREALFRRLTALGSDISILARAATDSKGREQGDSPFVLSLVSDGASGWKKAGDIIQTPDERLLREASPRGAFPRAVRISRRPAAPPGELPVSGRKIKMAPSAIDELIDCPFSYWCGHIARLETPRDEIGVFARDFQGTLMHELWRDIWTAYIGRGCRTPLVQTLIAEWDASLLRLAESYPKLRERSAVPVLAGLKDVMTLAAEAQDEAEARAANAGLKRVKTEFELHLPAYELENAVFSGRADRLDVWSGAGAVLIDYKLGASSKYKDSLQLACYAAILKASGESVAGFGYVGHRDGKIRGSWSPEVEGIYRGASRTKDDSVDEKISAAEDAMRLADSIAGAGVFPANYDSERCSSCLWGTICRRSERYGAFDGGEEGAGDE
ncbi:MAG: PD-(D/E)XK nuclease family protein [Synergistaceae bacterium]|jgi:hypothetical protein|nr:PD-(D/E)XK nuclease family protein [Synergistaceae bacterium]